jgi:hypothetical protein
MIIINDSSYIYYFKIRILSFKEVVRSAGTTPNKTEVIGSNPSPPSCADMPKKKKKEIKILSTY